MNFNSFIADFFVTIAGGVVLTGIFFWTREKVFPFPEVFGRWYLQLKTESTAYAPYEGMVLCYVAMLWRNGNQISGTVEKYYEDSSTGKREYVGENRTRGLINGYVEKRYFGPDQVHLHVVENGHGRESSHFMKLSVDSSDRMGGHFSSMIADQDGKAIWRREKF